MTREAIECSVLFADVCGSTRLYETLGDEKAQRVINECLQFMSRIVERHGGTVIKTIGDEVMVRFPDADSAVQAACEIQETNEGGQTHDGERVSLRTGLHFGPAILDETGDVFGDAVNIAARMAGIAKATQVITTGDTVDRLTNDDSCAMAREFDRATVKGKAEALRIFEVVWEKEDVTRIVGLQTRDDLRPTSSVLKLVYAGKEVSIDSAEKPVFVLGRGTQCDLLVPASLASRLHCRIEFRRGKFVLVDNSTNGTFVRTQDGKNVYLRREELLLWGSGLISLGEEVKASNDHLVQFACP